MGEKERPQQTKGRKKRLSSFLRESLKVNAESSDVGDGQFVVENETTDDDERSGHENAAPRNSNEERQVEIIETVSAELHISDDDAQETADSQNDHSGADKVIAGNQEEAATAFEESKPDFFGGIVRFFQKQEESVSAPEEGAIQNVPETTEDATLPNDELRLSNGSNHFDSFLNKLDSIDTSARRKTEEETNSIGRTSSSKKLRPLKEGASEKEVFVETDEKSSEEPTAAEKEIPTVEDAEADDRKVENEKNGDLFTNFKLLFSPKDDGAEAKSASSRGPAAEDSEKKNEGGKIDVKPMQKVHDQNLQDSVTDLEASASNGRGDNSVEQLGFDESPIKSDEADSTSSGEYASSGESTSSGEYASSDEYTSSDESSVVDSKSCPSFYDSGSFDNAASAVDDTPSDNRIEVDASKASDEEKRNEKTQTEGAAPRESTLPAVATDEKTPEKSTTAEKDIPPVKDEVDNMDTERIQKVDSQELQDTITDLKASASNGRGGNSVQQVGLDDASDETDSSSSGEYTSSDASTSSGEYASSDEYTSSDESSSADSNPSATENNASSRVVDNVASLADKTPSENRSEVDASKATESNASIRIVAKVASPTDGETASDKRDEVDASKAIGGEKQNEETETPPTAPRQSSLHAVTTEEKAPEEHAAAEKKIPPVETADAKDRKLENEKDSDLFSSFKQLFSPKDDGAKANSASVRGLAAEDLAGKDEGKTDVEPTQKVDDQDLQDIIADLEASASPDREKKASGLFSSIKRISENIIGLSPPSSSSAKRLEEEKEEKMKMMMEQCSFDEKDILAGVETQEKLILHSSQEMPAHEFSKPEENMRMVAQRKDKDVLVGAAISNSEVQSNGSKSYSDSELEEETIPAQQPSNFEQNFSIRANHDVGGMGVMNSETGSEDDSYETDSDLDTDEEAQEHEYAENEDMENDKVAGVSLEIKEVLDALEEAHEAIEILREENVKLDDDSRRMKLGLEEAVDSNDVLEQKILNLAGGFKQKEYAIKNELESKLQKAFENEEKLKKELEEIRNTSEGSSEEITLLSKTINELTVELDDHKEESEALLSQLSEMQGNFEFQATKLEAMKSQLLKAETELEMMQKYISNIEKKLESVAEEKDGLDGKLVQLQSEVAAHLSVIEALEKRLESEIQKANLDLGNQEKNENIVVTNENIKIGFGTPIKLADDFLRLPEAEDRDLGDVLVAPKAEEYEAKIEDLEIELATARTDLEEKLFFLASEKETDRAQIEALEFELAAGRTKLEEKLFAQNAEKEADQANNFSMERIELEEKLAAYESEKETNKAKIDSSEAHLVGLEEELAAERAETEALRLKLTLIEAELLQESNKLIEQLVLGRSENEELQAEVATLERQQAALFWEELASTKATETKTKQLEETEKLNKAIGEKEAIIQEFQKEHSPEEAIILAALSEKNTIVKEKEAAIAPQTKEISLGKKEVDDLKSERDKSEETLQNLREENAKLKERVDSLVRQEKNLEEKAASLIAKNGEYEKQTESLTVEVSEARESAEKMIFTSRQLSTESNQRAETIAKLENTLNEVTIERSMLRTQMATLGEEKKSYDLTAQLEAQLAEHKTLEAKLKEVEDSKTAEKRDFDLVTANLTAQTNTQREEYQLLQAKVKEGEASEVELASVTKQLGEKAQKIADLNAENERLSAENAKLRDQIDQLSSDKGTRNTRGVAKENSGRKVDTLAATVFTPKTDLTTGKASKAPATIKSAKQPLNSEPDKSTLQKKSLSDSNARSVPSPAKSKSKKKGKQLIEPVSTKKRNFVKRGLNNKYAVSTDEKLQQRKDRKKNRETFKGMKHFFGVKKSTARK